MRLTKENFFKKYPRHYGFVVDLGTSQAVAKRFKLLCQYFDKAAGAWTISRIKRQGRTKAIIAMEWKMDATGFGLGFDSEPLKRMPRSWYFGHRLKLTGKDWDRLANHFKRLNTESKR